MKLLSIGLVVLLLVTSSTGYFLFFKLRQHQIREAMERQLSAGVPDAVLALLKIPRHLEANPDGTFQRMHAREFRYQGVMYDVARQEQHGDTTWYYCVADERETQLMAELDEQVERKMNHDPAQKQPTDDLRHFFDLFFFQKETSHFTHSPDAKIHHVSRYFFHATTWHSSVASPPPEKV